MEISKLANRQSQRKEVAPRGGTIGDHLSVDK
jgi:hypothetical protein